MANMWHTDDQRLLREVLDLFPSDRLALLNPALLQFGVLLPSTILNAPFAQTADIVGDYAFKCTSYTIAKASVKAKSPVWRLVFDAGFKLHGSTVPYLFGSSSAATSPIGTQLKEYFISMIVHHDPNKAVKALLRTLPGKAKFPSYVDDVFGRNAVLYINDRGLSLTLGDPQQTKRCELFARRSDVFRN